MDKASVLKACGAMVIPAMLAGCSTMQTPEIDFCKDDWSGKGIEALENSNLAIYSDQPGRWRVTRIRTRSLSSGATPGFGIWSAGDSSEGLISGELVACGDSLWHKEVPIQGLVYDYLLGEESFVEKGISLSGYLQVDLTIQVGGYDWRDSKFQYSIQL